MLNHQPPEKIEAVLNAGLQFLGGLMEMATGRKISAGDPSGQMVRIDRDTGEVTLKFRLPDLCACARRLSGFVLAAKGW